MLLGSLRFALEILKLECAAARFCWCFAFFSFSLLFLFVVSGFLFFCLACFYLYWYYELCPFYLYNLLVFPKKKCYICPFL